MFLDFNLSREEELNPRPRGYEPRELPLLYPAIINAPKVCPVSGAGRRGGVFVGSRQINEDCPITNFDYPDE